MHPNDGGLKQAPQAGAYPPPQGAYGYQQTAPPPAAYNYQQGQGQWTTGLCDCFEDPSNCFTTCCCPCITFGQNAEVIDKGLTTCGSGGLIYYLLTHVGCSCLYSFPYRTKLRGLYSLPEDPCTDCCVHCMFSSCALCQEYRELKNRGLDPSIGWIANAQKMNQGAPPYVTPGMSR